MEEAGKGDEERREVGRGEREGVGNGCLTLCTSFVVMH